MATQTLRDLSVAQLKKAATIKGRIEVLERELNSLLGNSGPMARGGVVRRRRKMSAEGRARIAAGAKARWAKVKAKNKGA